VDTDGFIGRFLDGEMIAPISVINYDDAFAFLGFYIVRPEFRSQGFGYQLWQQAVRHAGHRVIGLDGVVDQQANYAKSGFDLAYRNIRHGGHIALPVPDEADLKITDDTGAAPGGVRSALFSVTAPGFPGELAVGRRPRRASGLGRAGYRGVWLDPPVSSRLESWASLRGLARFGAKFEPCVDIASDTCRTCRDLSRHA